MIPAQYKGPQTCQVFPIRPGDRASYLGSMNVEITADGACPSFDHGAMTGSGDKLPFFVTGSTENGHEWRNLGTDTTPWNAHAGATAIQAWVAERVGSDVYLVTGSNGQGRTVLGEHKISKVVAGIYDGTTTNIGPAEPVGHSDWPVISVGGRRDSLEAGKGPGAFYRNNVALGYEPILQLQESLANGLNCNAMAASEN